MCQDARARSAASHVYTQHQGRNQTSKQALRNFRPKLEVQIKQKTQKLLDDGCIKLIQHLIWLANIVPDKNKSIQIICSTNFCDLNKACPEDEFPLPSNDMLVHATIGHPMFAFMNGFSGYN